MPTPPVEMMKSLLLAIEADAVKRGWDADPVMYALHDPGSGPRATVLAREWPSGFSSERFEATSIALARGAASSAALPEAFITGIRTVARGIFGIALCHEAWARIGELTDEYVREHERSGRSIADDPLGQEVRTVSAYCADTSAYLVMRIRGHQPTFTHSIPRQAEDEGWHAAGRIYESLARMVAAVVGDPFGLHVDTVGGPGWYRDLHKGPRRG